VLEDGKGWSLAQERTCQLPNFQSILNNHYLLANKACRILKTLNWSSLPHNSVFLQVTIFVLRSIILFLQDNVWEFLGPDTVYLQAFRIPRRSQVVTKRKTFELNLMPRYCLCDHCGFLILAFRLQVQ